MTLIYVVEDDENIREIETIALKNSNYEVEAFDNAKDFYKKLEEKIPDLVLLDIMLPDKDGYEIIRDLRKKEETRRLPVIMVTAKSTEMDMVKGPDDGADDYIKKPFSIMELLSRVKALLRRTQDSKPKQYQIGSVVLNHEKRKVKVDGEEVEMTFKEYELLRYLMMNSGIVLSREAIMRQVWETDFEGESRTVDVHIKTLRKKLGDSGKIIRTVRNVGYIIEKTV